MMVSHTLTDHEQACRTIFAELDRAWQWDDRLETALVTFSREENESVLALLDRVFSSCWTSGTLSTAPQEVRQLIDEAAGLDAGQRFYHSPLDGGAFIFGAVWPWGNGQTISLRVGYREPDKAAALEELKAWFALT